MDLDISTLLDTNAALKKQLEACRHQIAELRIRNNYLQNTLAQISKER